MGAVGEDRNTGQLVPLPFCLIFGELGIHRLLDERAHERDLVGKTNNVVLDVMVLDCCRRKKSGRGRLLAIILGHLKFQKK